MPRAPRGKTRTLDRSVVVPRKLKQICVACDLPMKERSKEHFWPDWLIEWTGTHRTRVRFDPHKKINPKSLVVPLCNSCNSAFGRDLESPVAHAFRQLEAGNGISDVEAELIIRWLWKLEGLFWRFAHPNDFYSAKYTLKDRVLRPLDDIRSSLSLAIALAERIEPEFGDAPMGLDSWTRLSAIYVAGVFSRVAVMVLLQKFEDQVPDNFSIYRLSPVGAPDRDARLFHPKVGFRSCVEAVKRTREAALFLSYAHELDARNSNE